MPRSFRRDAVSAVASFVDRGNRLWAEMERQGHYLLLNFGVMTSDPELHAFSRVAGLAHLTVDLRAIDPEILERARAQLTGSSSR